MNNKRKTDLEIFFLYFFVGLIGGAVLLSVVYVIVDRGFAIQECKNSGGVIANDGSVNGRCVTVEKQNDSR